ncbi:hypothetical protein VTO42DRAFT_4329 [Malbranchea cinnamomea]
MGDNHVKTLVTVVAATEVQISFELCFKGEAREKPTTGKLFLVDEIAPTDESMSADGANTHPSGPESEKDASVESDLP